MLDFKVEQEGEEKRVTISGELNIENASALKDILISSLEKTESVVVNLENLTDVDLSCLQLFCSAYKTADASGKCFTISGNCSLVFKDAIKDARFLQNAGCGLPCEKRCLWSKN